LVGPEEISPASGTIPEIKDVQEEEEQNSNADDSKTSWTEPQVARVLEALKLSLRWLHEAEGDTRYWYSASLRHAEGEKQLKIEKDKVDQVVKLHEDKIKKMEEDLEDKDCKMEWLRECPGVSRGQDVRNIDTEE
jgi:hypothetical protein